MSELDPSQLIAVQGRRGSYSRQMLDQLFDIPEDRIVSLDTFDDVFKALDTHTVGRIVVAYANNAVGFIQEPYSRLTDHTAAERYFIDTEGVMPVQHCLLGLPGASIGDLAEIHSQAPAINQSTNFLASLRRGTKIVEGDDTALCAEMVAGSGDKRLAAIASIACIKYYPELVVLQQGVQNDPQNLTRFVSVVRDEDARINGQTNVTNAVMTLQQHEGSLAQALQVFDRLGVDLRFINSRLQPNSPFKVDMITEFRMGMPDPRFMQLVDGLSDVNARLECLGSFTEDTHFVLDYTTPAFESVDALEERTRHQAHLKRLIRK